MTVRVLTFQLTIFLLLEISFPVEKNKMLGFFLTLILNIPNVLNARI